MKRSEALSILKRFLDAANVSSNYVGGNIALAKDIIVLKEKIGMLPPPEYMNVLSLDAEKGVIGEISYPYPQDKYGQFPMWEPEDEEK